MIWVVKYTPPGGDVEMKWFRSYFDFADFCATLEKQGVRYFTRMLTSDLLLTVLEGIPGSVIHDLVFKEQKSGQGKR